MTTTKQQQVADQTTAAATGTAATAKATARRRWLVRLLVLGPAVALACGWAVLAGTFYGAVVPGWRSDHAMAEPQALMSSRPPR